MTKGGVLEALPIHNYRQCRKVAEYNEKILLNGIAKSR